MNTKLEVFFPFAWTLDEMLHWLDNRPELTDLDPVIS